MEIVSSASGPGTEVSTPSSPEFGSDTPQTSAQMRPRPDTSPEASRPSPGDGDPNQQPPNPEPKRESRYERTKRQRAELQKRESVLREREERIAQAERAKQAPKKPEYTAAELKEYRQAWENEGRFDLVEQADKEIARLEKLEQQQQGQQSFEQEWHTAERELGEVDPEFGAGKGTRLDKKLGEIMKGPDGNIYRQHPRGIIAAYHRAKMEILEGDHKTALGKIQQLETELKRLNGLTAIGSGASGRLSNGNRVESVHDFARLSSADMGKYLRSHANKTDTPWL